MTKIITALSEVSNRYDALLVDLWGCVHNGVTAFPGAVEALRTYREAGGIVVLVTNSPRARNRVERQLDTFNVPTDCWDTIATSGDSARAAMFRGMVGEKVYFIGQDSDLKFFDPLSIIDDPVEITRVPLDQAEGIVCAGPFDPSADPETWRPDLLFAKQKGMKFLCANPDIVVDRGHVREWCAGAVAKMYSEMGGESLYFGKPHPPIYDLTYRRLEAIRPGVQKSKMLAIGDGILTDIPGAIGEDIDSLFISGGLAAEQTKTGAQDGAQDGAQPDPAALKDYLASETIDPTYTIGLLR